MVYNHGPELIAAFYEVFKDELGEGFNIVIEATKRNNGSKLVLKKLTIRIHQLDYRIDFNVKTPKIAVLNGQWVELKLRWCNYLDK